MFNDQRLGSHSIREGAQISMLVNIGLIDFHIGSNLVREGTLRNSVHLSLSRFALSSGCGLLCSLFLGAGKEGLRKNVLIAVVE